MKKEPKLKHMPAAVMVERGLPVDLTLDPVTKEPSGIEKIAIMEIFEDVKEGITWYRMDKRQARKIHRAGAVVMAFWNHHAPSDLYQACMMGSAFELNPEYMDFDRYVRKLESHKHEVKYHGSFLQFWARSEYFNHIKIPDLPPCCFRRSFDDTTFQDDFEELWKNRNDWHDHFDDSDVPF